MNKEYEEARKKVADKILGFRHDKRLSEMPLEMRAIYLEWADEILSLQGDGWQIALVKNDMSGVGKPNFKHVIWEGE